MDFNSLIMKSCIYATKLLTYISLVKSQFTRRSCRCAFIITSICFIYENNSSDKRFSISFTTKDYRYLNTEIHFHSNEGNYFDEIRNCKGFVSSSQPLAIFNVNKPSNTYSVEFVFNLETELLPL